MNEEINFEEVAPWLVAGVTLLGGGLRILLLGSKGMWLDETFSVWLASHNVGELLRWTATVDQHPPLYYLLLHVWIALRGDSPYAVRLLSVLLGTATIPVIYGIGKRLSDPLMGFAAAVLLAVSPFHIRFAQETRMYTCVKAEGKSQRRESVAVSRVVAKRFHRVKSPVPPRLAASQANAARARASSARGRAQHASKR